MENLSFPKRQGQIRWKLASLWVLASVAGWAPRTGWGLVAGWAATTHGYVLGGWTPRAVLVTPPICGADAANLLCQGTPAGATPALPPNPETFHPGPESFPAEPMSPGPELSLAAPMPPGPEAPESPQPPETTQTIQKLFTLFLEKPTKENYLQVLDALCRHPAYDPYSQDLEDVDQLLKHRRYQEAKAKLDAAMPNLLLSPRAHNYYRVIAEALGDAQEAQRRDQIAQKCLQGIQATGQGMVDAAGGEPKQDQPPVAPFHVARVSDEYDLLRALGKRPRVHSHSLRRIEGRWYDVLRCSDEAGNVFHVWFDVTRPMAALRRNIQQPSQEEKMP